MPKNTDEEYALKISDLREGSVSVPLHKKVKPSLFVIESELDEAVELITETIENVATGNRIPEKLPKNVIPLFASLGKSLRDDETIEQVSKKGKVAHLNKLVKEEFEQLATGEYIDDFDIVGSVVMARVDKPRVAILDDDKNEIEAPFEQEDIQTILQALEHHKEARVRIAGSGMFSSAGVLKRVERVDLLTIVDSESEVTATTIPIWEQMIQISERLPENDKKQIPHDAASRIDHYLYGP